MTLLRIIINTKSRIKAHIAIAIPLVEFSFITNGTIALNMKTKTWKTNVINVRFKNFSKVFCLNSAIEISSMYFFFALICQIMFVIIQSIAYKLHVIHV